MAYLTWARLQGGRLTTRLSAVITSRNKRSLLRILEDWEWASSRSGSRTPARQCRGLLHRLRRHPAEHPARHLAGLHQRGNAKIKGGEFELQSVVSHGLTLNWRVRTSTLLHLREPYANIRRSCCRMARTSARPEGGGRTAAPGVRVVPPGSSQLVRSCQRPEVQVTCIRSTTFTWRTMARCAR